MAYVLLILALEHHPVAHPYHPLCFFNGTGFYYLSITCTNCYKHQKVMKPELPVS